MTTNNIDPSDLLDAIQEVVKNMCKHSPSRRLCDLVMVSALVSKLDEIRAEKNLAEKVKEKLETIQDCAKDLATVSETPIPEDNPSYQKIILEIGNLKSLSPLGFISRVQP